MTKLGQNPLSNVSSRPTLSVQSKAHTLEKPQLVERAETSAIPRYVDNPPPKYPAVARRKGWTGTVRLLVRVDTAGSVEKLLIAQSSGFSVLDRAARRAVRLWHFVPAMKAGLPVGSEVVIPVDFRLPGRADSVPQVHE